MDYSIHTYPRELAEEIISEWPEVPNPLDGLPPKEALRNEIVYRALDLEARELVEERADEAGTRHRAAYRLSRQHPECMIIIVSQDGAVRYVGNQNGKVIYWELGPFKPKNRI